jgi:hypothetical protein
MDSNELRHWGIPGMKWGVRRFQRKDGSLTPAGQKRRAKLEAELEQLKDKNDSNATPRKKTVGEMTDDELRDKTNRMQLEANYYNSQKNLAAANPKQVSKGEKFMNGLINDVVAPAAKNAGRSWLEKFMKDKLGLNEKDPLERLEKQAKKLELEKKIKDIKKGEPDLDNLVDQLNSLSDDQYDRLVKAASVKYYEEAVKGKGVKPDKGKNKKKDDDDDD